jgi:hypothetical protein
MEYAQVLNAGGDATNRSTIRAVCRQVLDPKNFDGAPASTEDFYYTGFANYMLGHHELARYDYERSGRLFEYYATLQGEPR